MVILFGLWFNMSVNSYGHFVWFVVNMSVNGYGHFVWFVVVSQRLLSFCLVCGLTCQSTAMVIMTIAVD